MRVPSSINNAARLARLLASLMLLLLGGGCSSTLDEKSARPWNSPRPEDQPKGWLWGLENSDEATGHH